MLLYLRKHQNVFFWCLADPMDCSTCSPGVCSNSCPLIRWCYLTISSSATLFSFCLQSFPTSGAFWWGGSSHQVAKVLKLQLSQQSSNEYSGLISFKIDCFDLLAIQGRDSQGTSPTPQFESINSLVFSLLYGLTLTSACDYWKNHSFDYTDLCQQSDVCFLIHCLVLS